MDLARKLGIGVVLMVPTFVISGLIWHIVGGSWLAVFAWVVAMGFIYSAIVTGKFAGFRKPAPPSGAEGDVKKPLPYSGSGH